MTLSNVVPAPTQRQRAVLRRTAALPVGRAWLMFGHDPDGYTVNIHPMVFAAWFGMLATALNLLPFGQLDGGHITYATLGSGSRRSSRSSPSLARGRDDRSLDQLAGA